MKGLWRRGALWTAAALLVCLPAVGMGDVVRLKDGSTINGKVVSLVGDTLTIRTSFGATLRVPRASVSVVSFGDTLAALPPAAQAPERKAEGGMGTIGVTFVDDNLSSKIGIYRNRDKEALMRANWIKVSLIVDEVEVYASIDSTMDKTIYQGPTRLYKNTIEFEDFDVDVPAGFHHAALLVRNVGLDDYKDAFDGDPLDMRLNLDNIQVSADKTLRVRVGIKRGKLRMGKPQLERK